MIAVEDLTIKIHKNNPGGFSFVIDGEELPENGTIFRFRVKKNHRYNMPVIEKIVPLDTDKINIDFTANDTKDLDPGIYYWNLAMMNENNEPWTILERAQGFFVLPEDGKGV